MSRPSASVVGIWLHSREEDRHGRVYRRRDFAFPPARGRGAVEFRSDGTYIEYGSGHDDRGRAVVGAWHDPGDGQVRITISRGADRVSARRVVSCTAEMLVIEE